MDWFRVGDEEQSGDAMDGGGGRVRRSEVFVSSERMG